MSVVIIQIYTLENILYKYIEFLELFVNRHNRKTFEENSVGVGSVRYSWTGAADPIIVGRYSLPACCLCISDISKHCGGFSHLWGAALRAVSPGSDSGRFSSPVPRTESRGWKLIRILIVNHVYFGRVVRCIRKYRPN